MYSLQDASSTNKPILTLFGHVFRVLGLNDRRRVRAARDFWRGLQRADLAGRSERYTRIYDAEHHSPGCVSMERRCPRGWSLGERVAAMMAYCT